MSDYVPTIGLEIHAELRTKTKMFCSSKNDPFAAEPNVHICPVCMAHPGTLPVINREAVRSVLKVGVALNAKLADYTEFDRKNYFYPDLPKGYQLSQYEYPLVSGGELKGVAITRIHLEEDTASSMHEDPSMGSGQGGMTTIDYNRAGVPLMELVTEPVITSASQAGDFARELQLLLRTLGASNANMEKGEMRVEANVSVAKATDGIKNKELGIKVEIKNLNSFRAMERAVAYEIKRQTKLLQEGGEVVQETRGWDEGKQATFAQRAKEGSADYRYFPDPDLPSLRLSEIAEFSKESLAGEMPELPWKRRERYLALGIKDDDAQLYVQEPVLGGFFEEVVSLLGSEDSKAVLLASNYVANDLVNIIRLRPDSAKAMTGKQGSGETKRDTEGRDSGYQAEIPISAKNFKAIIDMLAEEKLSSRAAKDILVACVRGEVDEPRRYAETKGLLKASQLALAGVVDEIVAKNPKVVADFRSGKEAALEFLVGQCMKTLRGAGDPAVLRELLIKNIKNLG